MPQALHITLDRRPGPAAGCYLLKSVHYPAECTRFDPTEKYASLEHRVVAKLEILDMHLQSSLGIIMAVSHDSRRIALATWDTVLVYALDPSAFLSREYCGLAADKEATTTLIWSSVGTNSTARARSMRMLWG